MHATKAVCLLLLIAMVGSSCVAFRYIPPRQEFYSFDSARDYRVAIEPSVPYYGFGITGLAANFAYSPVNHFAFSVNVYAETTVSKKYTSRSGLSANQYDQHSWSSYAKGFGAGVGFYDHIKSNISYDLFVTYDYQLPYYHYYYAKSTPYDGVGLSFSEPLHTLTLQPSIYIKGKVKTFQAGIGINGVFATSSHYYESPQMIGRFSMDLLIDPGIAFTEGHIQYGATAHISTFHPFYEYVAKDSFRDYRAWYQLPFNMYIRVMLSNDFFKSLKKKATTPK